MFFEHLQGWGLHHLPGQPVPMSDHSFSKEIFPNTRSKPPVTQLEAILNKAVEESISMSGRFFEWHKKGVRKNVRSKTKGFLP